MTHVHPVNERVAGRGPTPVSDISTAAIEIVPSDAEFAEFAVKAAVARRAELPVWQTDNAGVWDAYLDSFPPEHRQYHDCRACRKFIEGPGSLVTISEHGWTSSVFWNVPEGLADSYYGKVATRMRKVVERFTPTRPYANVGEGSHLGYTTWGTPRTQVGGEQHSHWFGRPVRTWTTPPADPSFVGEIEQGVKVVNQALEDHPKHVVALAQKLIALGRVPRADKISPLVDALAAIRAVPIRPPGVAQRDNVIRYWLTEVPNLCHVRGSVAATLLHDLGTMTPEAALAKYTPKVEGDKYMRPTVAPAAQTLERADALFTEKGYDRALARRWARVDEISCFWKPAPIEPPVEESKVFKGVKSRKAAPASPPLTTLRETRMSWAVFERDILPHMRGPWGELSLFRLMDRSAKYEVWRIWRVPPGANKRTDDLVPEMTDRAEAIRVFFRLVGEWAAMATVSAP